MASGEPHPWTLPILAARQSIIAAFATGAIASHLAASMTDSPWVEVPLIAALVLGGGPLVIELLMKVARREFGSDLLAGISIVTSVALDEYLAGTFVVLMLSGGEALERLAVRRASSVLAALARRVPSRAHRRLDGRLIDVDLNDVAIDDHLVVFPHEICPVDGIVIEGRGVMDESYLTGEPYVISKAPGVPVLSGAVNGESAITIRATKRAVDSRFARIVAVMRESEQRRPRLRRLGDQLGALYTPLALAIAGAAWAVSGDATRFLAVLVVATPCPLLIAIPVALIGAISLCAKRGIIIKDPTTLERIGRCRTIIFDKTGTLTYGEPRLDQAHYLDAMPPSEILGLAAAVERYSKHPLASAVLEAADRESLFLREANRISERPGEGLEGEVDGHLVAMTSRAEWLAKNAADAHRLPDVAAGLECLVAIDGRLAALFQFRDAARHEGKPFVEHLRGRHRFERILLVSGDREREVRYLAEQVGIEETYAGQSPEEKLAIVRAEQLRAQTVFVGDGVNDAPALTAATVGIAFGQNSEVSTEAAGVVVMDSSLEKVDEFFHVSRRMFNIALQSAVGGMALSALGMIAAAMGGLPPVAGAIAQESIDILAVLNALRAACPPRSLTDF
ncbi:MAG: cadmium-translocating P-type ATPase [Planctomycetes bacterium]|nr:cadmium-translocating P-type ATPase [Planctomycetota bacterium]